MRIAILIPGFQVEDTIGSVVSDALSMVGDVLVVDDGSTDRTAEVARAAGAEVLRHERNRGKGAALVTGMEHLRAQGFTHALSMDADGQHLGSELQVLLEACRSEPDAIIVGARRRDEDQEVAGIRRFGNDFANWWVAFASGRRFPDTQSGFRVYPLEKTLALQARGDRYQFESEVLILAARRGMAVSSRPVCVYYPPPSELVSHYRPWIDTIRIIRSVGAFSLGFRR